MNISGLFIKRPVATTLVMVGILLFGILAYFGLPVSALPNVDFPTILVQASLPGASPETMAASVATPLEREFSTIDGLDSMTSSSSLGSTSVTLQFDTSRELDSAAADVQAAIVRATPRMPKDMPSPPFYRKVNPADQPILYLALSSDTLPLYTVDEFAETNMSERISTVKGVAQVQVYGSKKYAVRVRVDPDALRAAASAWTRSPARSAAPTSTCRPGTLYSDSKAYTIQANGQLTDAAAYRPVVVAWRNGKPVRIDQIGSVTDSVENDKTAAWSLGKRSVVLAIQKQPGANTVEVSEAVKKLIPTFRADLPASVDLKILFDRSEIRGAVGERRGVHAALHAGAGRAGDLPLPAQALGHDHPSLAMPLAIVGTFAVMYLLGYSLDNLSLMALTLCVGFVVDDAIVMLENVVRHMEMGKPPMQAALDGAREIGFTILSMTVSLVAVFVPLLFLGGILGRLFKEFAVTIAVAILVSGFVFLTLTPMMASRFVRATARASRRAYQAVERVSTRLLRFTTALCCSCSATGASRSCSLWGARGATVLLVRGDPQRLPAHGGHRAGVRHDGSGGGHLLRRRARAAAGATRSCRRIPGRQLHVERRHARHHRGLNSGFMFMRLKPRSVRGDIDSVIARLRKKLGSVPGIRAFIQVPPQIRIGGTLRAASTSWRSRAPIDELYASAA